MQVGQLVDADVSYQPSSWVLRLHHTPRLFGPANFSPGSDLYILNLGLVALPFFLIGMGCMVYCLKYMRKACSPSKQDDPTIVGPYRKTRSLFIIPLVLLIGVFSVACYGQFLWGGVVGLVQRNVLSLEQSFMSTRSVSLEYRHRVDEFGASATSLIEACPQLKPKTTLLDSFMRSTNTDLLSISAAFQSARVAFRALSQTWVMSSWVFYGCLVSSTLSLVCVVLLGVMLCIVLMRKDPQRPARLLHWLLVPTAGCAALITFVAAGSLVSFSIGVADYCIDPQLYSAHWLPVDLQYIVNCTAGDNTFDALYQHLEDEHSEFSTALLKAERAECDSSPATDHLVKKLETAVGDLKTIVQRGQDAVKCRTVHKYYVQIAYDYVCNEGTYDLEILLASVAAMAVLVAIPLITSRRIAAPLPYEDRIDYSYSEDDIPYEATRLSQNQHSQPTYGARS